MPRLKSTHQILITLLILTAGRVPAEPGAVKATDVSPAGFENLDHVRVVSGPIRLEGDLDVGGELTADSFVHPKAGIRFPDGTVQVTAAAESRPRTRVEVLAGDDPVANGDALLAAVEGIEDASAVKPYLVSLDPGVYDLGSDSLRMKPWVSLEGSGEALTRIVAAGAATNAEATVVTADGVGLRRLTVENTGGDLNAVAVFANTRSTRLEQVTAIASGGEELNYGVRIVGAEALLSGVAALAQGGTVAYGVSLKDVEELLWDGGRAVASAAERNVGILVINEFGSPEMEVVLDGVSAGAEGGEEGSALEIRGAAGAQVLRSTLAVAGAATGYGLRIHGDPSPIPVRIAGSTIRARGPESYGIASSGAHFLRIDQSRVSGETHALSVDFGEAVRVGASCLEGGPVDVSFGSARCVATYDGSYEMLTAACR